MDASNVLDVDAVMIDFVGAMNLGLLSSLSRGFYLPRVRIFPFNRVCAVSVGGLAMTMSDVLVAVAHSPQSISLLHRSRFRGLLL